MWARLQLVWPPFWRKEHPTKETYFWNSLIIYQVITKKIITVKEIWRTRLNYYGFWRFYFSIYSFFSIEKIYQTLERVLYELLKLLEFRQNYSAAVAFSIFFSVFGYSDKTLSLVCDVIYQTRGTMFHQNIQTSRIEMKIRRASGVFLTKFEVFG